MSYFLRELLICWIQSVLFEAGNLCGKTNLARHLPTFLFVLIWGALWWKGAMRWKVPLVDGSKPDLTARQKKLHPRSLLKSRFPFASINHDQAKQNRKKQRISPSRLASSEFFGGCGPFRVGVGCFRSNIFGLRRVVLCRFTRPSLHRKKFHPLHLQV